MTARAHLIKQTRRFILSSLNLLYPNPFEFRSLLRAVAGSYPDYGEDLLRKDLHYLAEKGYVVIERKDPFGDPLPPDRILVKLTAQGNEVSNSIITDLALEV